MEFAIESFEDMEVRIANLSKQEQIEEHRKYFALKVSYNKTKKAIEQKEAYLNSPMADEIRSNNAIGMNEDIERLNEDIEKKEMKLSVQKAIVENKAEKDRTPDEKTLCYLNTQRDNTITASDATIQNQLNILTKSDEAFERDLADAKEMYDKKVRKITESHQRGRAFMEANIEGSRRQKDIKLQALDTKIQKVSDRIEASYDKGKDSSVLKVELELKELREKKSEIQNLLS